MNHKSYLLILFCMAIALAAFIAITADQNNRIKRQDSIIAEKTDSITYRKTEAGKLIADKLAAEATAKEFAQAYPAFAESLRRDFDIKISNLKAYLRSEFQAHGTGNTTIENHYITDSTGRRVSFQDFKIDDGYLSLRATVFDSLHAPYEYFYEDTLQVAFHTKKKWFLGNQKLYGSGMLSNKNARIVNQTSVLIKNYRDKRFNVSVGVLYDPLSSEWHPGISLGFSLLSF